MSAWDVVLRFVVLGGALLACFGAADLVADWLDRRGGRRWMD